MSEKSHIIITKNDNQVLDIETDSYLLLHLVDGKIKPHGEIDVKALAPLLMKAVLEKVVKS